MIKRIFNRTCWGFIAVWEEGKGKAIGQPHRGIFIDTPFFRLDAGQFPSPRGFTFKLRKGARPYPKFRKDI